MSDFNGLPWDEKPKPAPDQVGPWSDKRQPVDPPKTETPPLVTAQQLKAISPGTPLERCAEFVPHINKYCPLYGIDTPIELVSFLAQILHETGGLKWLREIWGPSAQQNRYERDFKADWPGPRGGRNSLAYSLGNYLKGDGKLFMGRGGIMYTGRTNYQQLSREMFKDDRLLLNPDIITAPEYAVWSACIYWKKRKLDRHDDDKDIRKETKAVNGGYNGYDDRRKYMDRGIKTFNIK